MNVVATVQDAIVSLVKPLKKKVSIGFLYDWQHMFIVDNVVSIT